MTRSTITRVRALGVAAVALVAAIASVAAAVSVQQRQDPAMSWIDQYYADYTAMSAAPAGPAMDKWLAHYEPSALFEDPTLGQSATGHDRIRKPYLDAFTGPLGPVRWTIVRRLAGGDWMAVEGWVEGTQNGRPFRTRFTTWLKVQNGKIAHQIDYVDYATIRRLTASKIP